MAVAVAVAAEAMMRMVLVSPALTCEAMLCFSGAPIACECESPSSPRILAGHQPENGDVSDGKQLSTITTEPSRPQHHAFLDFLLHTRHLTSCLQQCSGVNNIAVPALKYFLHADTIFSQIWRPSTRRCLSASALRTFSARQHPPIPRATMAIEFSSTWVLASISKLNARSHKTTQTTGGRFLTYQGRPRSHELMIKQS